MLANTHNQLKSLDREAVSYPGHTMKPVTTTGCFKVLATIERV